MFGDLSFYFSSPSLFFQVKAFVLRFILEICIFIFFTTTFLSNKRPCFEIYLFLLTPQTFPMQGTLLFRDLSFSSNLPNPFFQVNVAASHT